MTRSVVSMDLEDSWQHSHRQCHMELDYVPLFTSLGYCNCTLLVARRHPLAVQQPPQKLRRVFPCLSSCLHQHLFQCSRKRFTDQDLSDWCHPLYLQCPLWQHATIHKMDLSRNRFTQCPLVLVRQFMKTLQVLNLAHNRICHWPDNRQVFEQLVELDLSHNHLVQLPKTLALKCPQLKVFRIYDNQIEYLDAELWYPWRLQLTLFQCGSLVFGGNRLTRLSPSFFYSCASLLDLDLSHQRLTRLDESIGSLSQLQRLCLAYNHLERLPESVRHLENLSVLICSHNALIELPTSLVLLTNLVHLDVSNNWMESLDGVLVDGIVKERKGRVFYSGNPCTLISFTNEAMNRSIHETINQTKIHDSWNAHKSVPSLLEWSARAVLLSQQDTTLILPPRLEKQLSWMKKRVCFMCQSPVLGRTLTCLRRAPVGEDIAWRWDCCCSMKCWRLSNNH